MNNYPVLIKNSEKKDLEKLKQSHLVTNFQEIIDTLKVNPYAPTQSFEKNYPKSSGRYSRRINVQHRVVYKVSEELNQVEIYPAWTHYE